MSNHFWDARYTKVEARKAVRRAYALGWDADTLRRRVYEACLNAKTDEAQRRLVFIEEWLDS